MLSRPYLISDFEPLNIDVIQRHDVHIYLLYNMTTLRLLTILCKYIILLLYFYRLLYICMLSLS